ncbi:unnamed protein product [Heligmosomoides polygyrus]|uniref:Succinate dehydrogenase assembly factor 4, mitochondrial n=1 Tax=Heligmosomoides polygyrus TaxID=6339 RepID=A0A183FL82_HELPZ|nr:unnamed protein product [Heligmosomoides polygyrus]
MIRATSRNLAYRPYSQVQHRGAEPYEDPYLKKQLGGVNSITGEIGGPEPTRYGDWERKGRVSDF